MQDKDGVAKGGLTQGATLGYAAVVIAVPYVNYHYKVWIPTATVPSGDKFEEWLEASYPGDHENEAYEDMTLYQKGLFKKELAAGTPSIKPGTILVGHWDTMTISVPKKAVNTMLSVTDYDAIAARTKGLEVIQGNILNNIIGDPASYTDPVGNFTAITDKPIAVGYSGGLITASKEIQTGTSNSFSMEVEQTIKSGAGLGGLTVGYSAGFGFGTGTTIGKFEGVTYTGSVDSLTSKATLYDFQWEFGQGVARLNGDMIPVLQYRVSGVIQPPRTPKNFCVKEANTEEVTVEWDRTTDAICKLCGFSYNSLKFHNRNIYRKLGVKNRKEAEYKVEKIGLYK